jgi:iron complex outermembrane recepter protein
MRFASAFASVLCLVCLSSAPAIAQDSGAAAPPTPAPPAASELPPVEVIQKKSTPTPKAAQKKSAPKKQVAAPAPAPAPVAPVQTTEPLVAGTGGIDSGTVNMSPVAGSEIPISKYPGAVGRASSQDIAKFHDASIPEVLQNTVPGVVLGDAQGNVYQRNLQYRGFEASPVNGVPQGLAVYQNGVRINESFGDIVNWDFLPDNAIDGISILGANPVYGLNALGGAVGIVMRDGFNFQGVEIDSRFGSFGHAQGSVAAGARSGNWGAFIAGEYIQDDGYRDFSEAEIKRMYADIGVKGDGVELHLNYTGADNHVGVTAAAPEQLLDLGWNRTFTSPQTTDNELSMLSMNGSVKATSTLTFSGVGYYRWFKQKHDDGNIAEALECDAGSGAPGEVCLEEDDDVAENANGDTMTFDPDTSYGTIDRTSQDAKGYGAAVQAVDKTRLFGMGNQFLVGASYDHGDVDYTANSELGFFGPKFVVNSFATPFYLEEPDDVRPRAIATTNDYVGIYVSNTTDVTKDFALTLGGRWNYARIDLLNENPDPSEEDKLTGTHKYYRFNPMAGATYNLMPGLTLYGGYSEANRAPTAAELACADPEAPCLIESFLTADPPLKQVVSHTFELGLRGKLASWNSGQLEWTAGLFRTENSDDILAVASPINGRGYFLNAGDTLRQGFEAGVQYRDTRWQWYANYAFIDATFETANVLSSPDNHTGAAFECDDPSDPDPDFDEPLCINVNPGDRLPGVPRHRFKAGADYWVTSAWKVGADVVAASDQVFFGDEGNDGIPLDGYAKVDIRTSYNITEHVQIYGMVDNVFDSRYGLFGNYFNQEAANSAGRADGLPADYFGDEDGNNRTITPAPPVTAYGGIKVKY